VSNAERERDEGRARLHHLQPEPPRQVVGKPGRTHLRDARPAGGDHQCGRAVLTYVKHAAVMADFAHLGPAAHLDRAFGAFLQQHLDDLPCRTVAE
jgi:hypothetical protein